jgi:hypothetical protein
VPVAMLLKRASESPAPSASETIRVLGLGAAAGSGRLKARIRGAVVNRVSPAGVVGGDGDLQLVGRRRADRRPKGDVP